MKDKQDLWALFAINAGPVPDWFQGSAPVGPVREDYLTDAQYTIFSNHHTGLGWRFEQLKHTPEFRLNADYEDIGDAWMEVSDELMDLVELYLHAVTLYQLQHHVYKTERRSFEWIKYHADKMLSLVPA